MKKIKSLFIVLSIAIMGLGTVSASEVIPNTELYPAVAIGDSLIYEIEDGDLQRLNVTDISKNGMRISIDYDMDLWDGSKYVSDESDIMKYNMDGATLGDLFDSEVPLILWNNFEFTTELADAFLYSINDELNVEATIDSWSAHTITVSIDGSDPSVFTYGSDGLLEYVSLNGVVMGTLIRSDSTITYTPTTIPIAGYTIPIIIGLIGIIIIAYAYMKQR